MNEQTMQEKADRLTKLRLKYPDLELYYEMSTCLTTIILTDFRIEEQFKRIEEMLQQYEIKKRATLKDNHVG